MDRTSDFSIHSSIFTAAVSRITTISFLDFVQKHYYDVGRSGGHNECDYSAENFNRSPNHQKICNRIPRSNRFFHGRTIEFDVDIKHKESEEHSNNAFKP